MEKLFEVLGLMSFAGGSIGQHTQRQDNDVVRYSDLQALAKQQEVNARIDKLEARQDKTDERIENLANAVMKTNESVNAISNGVNDIKEALGI